MSSWIQLPTFAKDRTGQLRARPWSSVVAGSGHFQKETIHVQAEEILAIVTPFSKHSTLGKQLGNTTFILTRPTRLLDTLSIKPPSFDRLFFFLSLYTLLSQLPYHLHTHKPSLRALSSFHFPTSQLDLSSNTMADSVGPEQQRPVRFIVGAWSIVFMFACIRSLVLLVTVDALSATSGMQLPHTPTHVTMYIPFVLPCC